MSLKHEEDTSNNILIVANEESDVEPFKQWFLNSGFHVDLALDAIHAVADAREYHYRWVFIDCQLDEDFAGLDVFWLLKPYINSEHVVMMSREIDKHRIQRVTAQGLHHLIHKPFDLERSHAELDKVFSENERLFKSKTSLFPFKGFFQRFFSTE